MERWGKDTQEQAATMSSGSNDSNIRGTSKAVCRSFPFYVLSLRLSVEFLNSIKHREKVKRNTPAASSSSGVNAAYSVL